MILHFSLYSGVLMNSENGHSLQNHDTKVTGNTDGICVLENVLVKTADRSTLIEVDHAFKAPAINDQWDLSSFINRKGSAPSIGLIQQTSANTSTKSTYVGSQNIILPKRKSSFDPEPLEKVAKSSVTPSINRKTLSTSTPVIQPTNGAIINTTSIDISNQKKLTLKRKTSELVQEIDKSTVLQATTSSGNLQTQKKVTTNNDTKARAIDRPDDEQRAMPTLTTEIKSNKVSDKMMASSSTASLSSATTSNNNDPNIEKNYNIAQIFFHYPSDSENDIRDFLFINTYKNHSEYTCTKHAWAKVTVHILTVLLQRVADVRHILHDNESYYNKLLLITGLYVKQYAEKLMFGMAVNPNAEGCNKEQANPANIVCSIETNTEFNCITLTLKNHGIEAEFNIFVRKLNAKIIIMVNRYYQSLQRYYLLEPERNIVVLEHQIPPYFHVALKSDRTDIKSNLNRLSICLGNDKKNLLKCHIRQCSGVLMDEKQLKEIWGRIIVDMAVDMLSKIFAINLSSNTTALQFVHTSYGRSFDMTGLFDVFSSRGEAKGVHGHYGRYKKEIGKTIIKLRAPGQFRQPLRGILNVYIDDDSEGLVTMDMYDLVVNQEKSIMRQFITDLKLIYIPLIDALFEEYINGYVIPAANYFH